MSNLLLSRENTDIIRPALTSLTSVSVGSSVTMIKAFLITMMLCPGAQKKAQDELDVVLGTSAKNEVLHLPNI